MIANVAALGPLRFLVAPPAAPVLSPEAMAWAVRYVADRLHALGHDAGTEERLLALIADPYQREATREALRRLETP